MIALCFVGLPGQHLSFKDPMSKPTVDPTSNAKAGPAVPVNFLRPIIQADLDSGKHTQIVTRFPPEPNGYLHIGHAKSICVNFGLAQEFGGVTHLRFDDTNPAKEDQEYIDAIESDVKWLGFEWSGEVRYASQYFDQLHDWAVELIKAGKAYVDDLTPEQAKEYRGSLTEPGKNSPFRDRSGGREPRLVRPHARRRVPGRCPRAARQDRHGLAEHEPARPDHVPHPPCPPPPDR
jgi:glutaminyl-tRNA synthetase